MLRFLFDRRSISSVPWGQNSTWGIWPGDNVGPTWAGINVDSTTAPRLLTVYGCVRLISDAISTLPVDTFRKRPDGVKEEIAPPRWLEQPTPDLDFTEWCGQVLWSLLINGNAYIAVLRANAQIVELFVLDPTKVDVQRGGSMGTGRKQYLVNGHPYIGELVHIKAVMAPGSDLGYSPLEAARQSIGLGLAAQQFGAGFFTNEGNMPGVIELPNKAQPDTLKNLAEQWRRKRTKGGRGLPGVLQDGAQWKATGVTNEQAQFLETRKFSAAEIAGQMFLVDPSDLGIPVEGTSLTYANLEQRNARRVQVTLLPWLIRIENAISALMLRPRFMKFNVEGLLRGDQKTRYESYAIGIKNHFLLPNEAREKEDKPPLEGGDEWPVLGSEVAPANANAA